MIASLLSPTASGQPRERVSQLLPTVKCSTCHKPVPLDELGEHICSAPKSSPSPPPPAGLLSSNSQILQNRELTTSPASSSPSPPLSSPSPSPPPAQPTQPRHQREGSSASSRLRINTLGRAPPSPTNQSFKSSPLARKTSDNVRRDTSTPRPRDPPPTVDTRSRAPSNAGSIAPTPSTARPSASFNSNGQDTTPVQAAPTRPPFTNAPPAQGTPPQMGVPPSPGPNVPKNGPPSPMNGAPFPRGPPPPTTAFGGSPVPPAMGYPPRGPPMQSPSPIVGGPRVMGHTSMGPRMPTYPPMKTNQSIRPEDAFVHPAERGIDTKSGGEAGMAGVGRRGFAAAARAAMFIQPMHGSPGPYHDNRRPNAPYLDMAAASQRTETPPLSAGSGYSSHSPGPTSPLPHSDFSGHHQPPSPSALTPTGQRTKPSLTIPLPNDQSHMNNMSLSSPLSPRLPFFEKFKNKLPMSPSTEKGPSPSPLNNGTSIFNMDNITRPRADTSATASTTSSRSGGGLGYLRSGSSTTGSDTSATSQRKQTPVPKRPINHKSPSSSADSGSEYSGLAYADSTDYESNDDEKPPHKDSTVPQSFARSVSNGSRVQFGSVAGRSRSRSHSRSGIRIGDGSTLGGSTHSRDNSASSYSSATDGEGDDAVRGRNSAERPGFGRTRSNSSAIAQALGLSQRPPSEYAKLGGPGVRRSGSRLGRKMSESTTSSAMTENKDRPLPSESSRLVHFKKPSIDQLMASNSLRSLSRERIAKDAEDEVLNISVGLKAQRSNTVQGVQSPDVKPIKLPTRAQSERDSSERTVPKRTRKIRTCLKCSKSIDDGRWVQVDGGGILCEKCWKNMYLPKCRRCNLPIEKQAVSSSDGQLKGKYHKECFNCHNCHTPFPDKTFYVYDGKPLCAYHYHEANDSLCAAARCGQPIEGPCALSHTGDRYHPEHMTCEYPGYPECDERLTEYWEVDGRMLCERHVYYSSRMGSEADDTERWSKSKRATKRVTRFIDLANGGDTPRDSLVDLR